MSFMMRRGINSSGALGESAGGWPTEYNSTLLRYFKTDEISGGAFDEISSTTKSVRDITYSQAGIINNSFKFGVNGYIDITGDMNSSDSTMYSFWMNVLPSTVGTHYVRQSRAGSDTVQLYMTTDNKMFFSEIGNVFSATIAGGWRHFLCYATNQQLDGKNSRIYVDGVETYQSHTNIPVAGVPSSGTSTVERFGTEVSGSGANTEIDEIAIWRNQTFTDEAELNELAVTLYNGGAGVAVVLP